MSSSVRPRRPLRPVRRAPADLTPRFRFSSVSSFPNRSRSHPQGLNGCTRSNSTAIVWPRASTTAACSFSPGFDWTGKYPSAIAALANVKAKTAYLDGELCGVDDAGSPSFAKTQAATDGERAVRLVYYAFDLLHLDGRDVSRLPLIERKALLEPMIAGKPGLQFNGHETGDGELILTHAGKLGFEGVVSKTIDAPYAPGNRGLWRKAKWLNRQEFVIVGLVRSGRMRGHTWARCCWATMTMTASSSTLAAWALGCPSRSCRSPAPFGPASPQDVAIERRTAAQYALRLAAVLSHVHWVEPKLVADITYLTWTADGLLRHTVFVGLREDKPATDVRRETARVR